MPSHRPWHTVLLLSLLSLPPAGSAADYELGAGYRLDRLPVTLGGYATARLSDRAGRAARGEISDLSLFISAEHGARWRFFSEMEVGEPLVVDDGRWTTTDAEFDLERMYVDYAAGPALNVRVGKYLTPIGRWNEVHADPLVWTTSRPTVTEMPYSRQSSGAMLYGDVATPAGTFEYSLFGDATRHVDPLREQEALESLGAVALPSNNFDHGAGVRIRQHLAADAVTLGAVVARYGMRGQRDAKTAAGIDLSVEAAGWEITGEALYRFSAGDEGDEWGAYLQTVRPLRPGLYGIARLEAYAPARGATLRAGVLGLAWRPRQGLVLKAEYRGGAHNAVLAPDGWLGSVSVLF